MNKSPQVALIIESSVSYGRNILRGIARYMASHHRWSVYFEQHELGAPPPAWLDSSHWDGILCRPTDPVLARRLKRMKVPVVDLNDLYENLNFPWVGSNHRAIGCLGANHFWNGVSTILLFADSATNFGLNNAALDSAPSPRKPAHPCPFMNLPGVAQPSPAGIWKWNTSANG